MPIVLEVGLNFKNILGNSCVVVGSWRVCGFWNYACVRRLAWSFVWVGFRNMCVYLGGGYFSNVCGILCGSK
jgi:hypothetical protein